MSHIFISYSRADLGVVQALVEKIRRRNYRVWMDKSDIKAGTNWQNAIEQAIQASAALLVVISPKSIDSEWVGIEYNAALDHGLPVIPYLCCGATEKDLPLRLRRHNAVFEGDPQAFEKLLEAFPREAHIHASEVIDRDLIGRSDLTFDQVGQEVQGALRFALRFGDEDIALVGLPLQPTRYCTTYLVGRAEDTLKWLPQAQLGIQLSQAYPGDHFPVGIAEYLAAQHGPKFPMRLLLVRGPLRISFYKGKYGASYGLDATTPEEWQDVVEAARAAVRFYERGHDRPDLQIFHLGPGVILYRLGEGWREYTRTELFQRVPAEKRYVRVL